ncbi:hypothetical protein GH714_004389 [Hevea brasiliensis]|uniref:Homeobox domain-containing protein n=1 Tax=Hevea brasiliensis TaxID=3981 RepID=A0A6A6NBP1_HEVBR|nr:hypothetical protein GH714_004389 [Hevea brasiliensis]
MESEKRSMGGSGGAQVNSRWNPTKEQISMLESLYKQGIRTPSAEQIQQITSRLQDYGRIEGKNVFYWFQNHKARQRQKQKQESMAYINHYLHKAYQPVFATRCPNERFRVFPQCPKVLLPSGFKRRPRSEKIDKAKACTFTNWKQGSINGKCFSNNQETLPLFPLHPTGILQEKDETVCSLGSSITYVDDNSIANSTPISSETTTGVEDGSSDKLLDFFTGQGPSLL